MAHKVNPFSFFKLKYFSLKQKNNKILFNTGFTGPKLDPTENFLTNLIAGFKNITELKIVSTLKPVSLNFFVSSFFVYRRT